MSEHKIYVRIGEGTISVPTLLPYLSQSLDIGFVMDPDLMEEEDAVNCRWLGFGIGKGVTNPTENISSFAIPNKLYHGLHADLLKDFPGVDPHPLCYEEYTHIKGFGGFTRWVYFADPENRAPVFGIDWSILARPTSGVANSMVKMREVVRAAANHGIPQNAEVAFLNWHMCEPPCMTKVKKELEIWKVMDWLQNADTLFSFESPFCPRCGLKTITKKTNYCVRCGGNPKLFWKGRLRRI